MMFLIKAFNFEESYHDTDEVALYIHLSIVLVNLTLIYINIVQMELRLFMMRAFFIIWNKSFPNGVENMLQYHTSTHTNTLLGCEKIQYWLRTYWDCYIMSKMHKHVHIYVRPYVSWGTVGSSVTWTCNVSRKVALLLLLGSIEWTTWRFKWLSILTNNNHFYY